MTVIDGTRQSQTREVDIEAAFAAATAPDRRQAQEEYRCALALWGGDPQTQDLLGQVETFFWGLWKPKLQSKALTVARKVIRENDEAAKVFARWNRGTIVAPPISPQQIVRDLATVIAIEALRRSLPENPDARRKEVEKLRDESDALWEKLDAEMKRLDKHRKDARAAVEQAEGAVSFAEERAQHLTILREKYPDLAKAAAADGIQTR